MARIATVVVDVMGGDHAPDVVVTGVRTALEHDPDLRIVLTGPADVVIPLAEEIDRLSAVPTTEVIAMDEHPATAVRSKKDSSIVVGCRLVREGHADGFFSAGSTGACMAAATLVMGRIRGISRPAIAAIIPASDRPSVLLDVGANADCKAGNLVQFAHMGSAYARVVLDIAEPRVGLLNIGEEPTKGSALAQEAHALMVEQVSGFVGNVEGRDVPAGTVDVIVTDGFTGNVALKVLEGLAASLFARIRDVMTASFATTMAAAVLKPGLTELKRRIDPEVHGGAPLLGVDGVCVIGHGSSGPKAIANGVHACARAVRAGLTDMIAEAVATPDA